MWQSTTPGDNYRLPAPRLGEFQEAVKRHCDKIAWVNPYAVTLTLKLALGPVRLDSIIASQNVHHFLSRLNRSVLGRRRSTRERLKSFSVFESGQRPHFHLCIDCPTTISWHTFESTVRTCWSLTDWSRRQVVVEPCYQIEGWLNYMGKTRTKACYPEAIDWINCRH